MTNKEAIKLFRFYQGEIICDKEMKEALDLAIKALEERPTVCGNNPKWCENCVSKGKCASTRPQGKLIIKNHMETCEKCGSVMPMMNDYYRAKLRGCPYCLTEFTNLADI